MVEVEKHTIYLLLTLLSINQLFAQGIERNTFYDQDQKVPKEVFHVKDTISNLLSGAYTSYYLSGSIKSKGEYAHNRANGAWIYYYENGNVKNKGSFFRGRTMGIWTYYFESGNIRSEGILDNNVREGEWTFYYEDGGVKSIGHFAEGVRQGDWQYYYEDGGLKAQADYKNGSGHYKEYFVSGDLKMEGLNREGKSDSLWTYYYESGEKLAEGYYRKGLKTGPWKYFHKNGQRSAEGGFENGETIGNWIYYHENGNKSAEGIQKNGHKDGYWKMFYETGETKGVGELDKGSGNYTEYYISGKLKVQGQFKDDKNHGIWTYYDEEGHIEGRASFLEGVGYYEGYYLNGNVKMKGKIENGRRVDEWTLYKKNGDVAGKYHPVYHDENPMYISDADLTRPREKEDYDKPDYRFKRRKSRYFKEVVNEYKGVIIGTNPAFSLLGFVPVSLEYYLQERMGYEVQYTYHRTPFFTSHDDMNPSDLYTDGFSLLMKQKFYSPDQRYGMFYFGQVLGYQGLTHGVNLRNQTTDMTSLREQRIHYGVIIGNRWMRHPGNAGPTLDVYFGFGVGGKFFEEQYDNNQYDSEFQEINQNGFYVPIFFGVNIGYLVFKKSRGF